MSKPLDDKKAAAFSEKLIGILNNGGLCLMISVGHRTGLFDVMTRMPPATSEEIATESHLNERYIREWLGAMTVGGIVDCDPTGPKFSLPAEHAAFLTRAVGADNIAIFAQYIPLLASVEDQIVDCFRKGGGVPYSEFKRFHEVMAEDSGQSVMFSLLDKILPIANGLTDRLKKGIDVLDVGCGMGRALNLMAKTFPNSTFTGFDLSTEAIQGAQKEAKQNRAENVRFEQRDLTKFPAEKQYDFITAFDAIHDQARPDLVLSGIHKALRSDGVFLMQDIAGSSYPNKNMNLPLAPLLYTVSCMHCMTVSLAQAGRGLGAMWGEEKATEMLKAAGFSRIEIKRLSHDIQNCYYIVGKS